MSLSGETGGDLPDHVRNQLRAMGFELNHDALKRLSPAEREAFAAELAAIEEAMERNPLQGYYPHEKQVTFHSFGKEPGVFFRLFAGGNRSGKTTGGIGDDIIQALDWDDVPDHLHVIKKWDPPFYCRIITPDLVDTLEGVVYDKLRDMIPPHTLKGGGWGPQSFSKKQRMLWFANGSRFQFMSFEMESFKMGGAALHRVHFDEEPPKRVWEENRTRLADYPGAEAIFTFTPLQGMTWLYDDLYLPGIQGTDPMTRVVEVDMDDNPHLTSGQKKVALAGASQADLQARKSGKFVSFAGLIYAGQYFKQDEHVVPQHTPPVNVEFLEGHDPGIQFMAGALQCYLDSDDVLTVFNEHAFTNGETIPVICNVVVKSRGEYGYERPRLAVIDPSAKTRDKETGRSNLIAYHDWGIPAIPAQNDVLAGIAEVRRRFEQGKLRITANCEELIRELNRYRWKEQSQKKDYEEDDHRAKPVKRDDHLADCLRYICMARPLPPDPLSPLLVETPLERLKREDFEASAERATVPVTDLGGIYA